MRDNKLIFSNNKNPIYETIKNAKKFIKIVIFQLTNKKIIDMLINRAKEDVKIEIITLPPDSFKKVEERSKIAKYYDELRKHNVKLELCDWEVGDPSLTDTSQSGRLAEGGGRKWYSLHGKFIVTDHNALLLSANFIDLDEWDVYLSVFDKEIQKLLEDKMNEIRKLFINPSDLDNEINGKIFDGLSKEIQTEIKKLWKSSQRKNVKSYPPSISPVNKITPGLKICPFDGRAREFFKELISSAEKFLYICSERIFDEKVITRLRDKTNKKDIDIKIIAGPPKKVRQSPLKAKEQILQLLSFGIDLRLLNNIHTKFWLTEKWLMIGSSNLTKMNLGFKKTGNFWRGNTETLYFTNDEMLINAGKQEFEKFFKQGEIGIISIAQGSKELGVAKSWFDSYSMNSTMDARELLSRITLYSDIKTKKKIKQIVKYSIKIAKTMNLPRIDDIHVAMAYILFEIQFKAQTKAELIREYEDLLGTKRVQNAISELINLQYCKFEGAQLLLNVDKIL